MSESASNNPSDGFVRVETCKAVQKGVFQQIGRNRDDISGLNKKLWGMIILNLTAVVGIAVNLYLTVVGA